MYSQRCQTEEGISIDNNEVDHYDADVVSAQDYYPFGMMQPGRNMSTGKYRYGFNGKERDDEVKGDGASIDFGSAGCMIQGSPDG